MQGAWTLFSLLAIAAALPIEGMFQRGAGSTSCASLLTCLVGGIKTDQDLKPRAAEVDTPAGVQIVKRTDNSEKKRSGLAKFAFYDEPLFYPGAYPEEQK